MAIFGVTNAAAMTEVDSPDQTTQFTHGVADIGIYQDADISEQLAVDTAASNRKNGCVSGYVCAWADTYYSGDAVFLAPCACIGTHTYTEHHIQEDTPGGQSFNDRASSFYDHWGSGDVVLAQNDRFYDYGNYYSGKFLCVEGSFADPKLSTTATGDFNDMLSMEKYNRDYSCYK